jgi:GMP synthase (glutamine-hydrolysing)
VPSLLVIKTGSTLPSVAARRRDYETWITTGSGFLAADVRVVTVYQDEPLPTPQSVDGIVVSGSSAMVTDRASWSERTAEWLLTAISVGKPVLGICFGHQLLAQACGGQVEDNPRGRQVGTVDVTLKPAAEADRLFGVFSEPLHVPVCHRQCVTRLPPDATWLAESPLDAFHAVRFGASAWGIQFHPEFDVPILRAYIDSFREDLAREKIDAQAIWNDAMDSADGTILLRRFADIVRGRA